MRNVCIDTVPDSFTAAGIPQNRVLHFAPLQSLVRVLHALGVHVESTLRAVRRWVSYGGEAHVNLRAVESRPAPPPPSKPQAGQLTLRALRLKHARTGHVRHLPSEREAPPLR